MKRFFKSPAVLVGAGALGALVVYKASKTVAGYVDSAADKVRGLFAKGGK